MFDTLIVFLKQFFEKVDFEKIHLKTKKHEKFPGGKDCYMQKRQFHNNLNVKAHFVGFEKLCIKKVDALILKWPIRTKASAFVVC